MTKKKLAEQYEQEIIKDDKKDEQVESKKDDINARVISIKEKGEKKKRVKKSSVYNTLFLERDEDFHVVFKALNMIIKKTRFEHWEFTDEEIKEISPEINLVLGFHFGSLTLYSHHFALAALMISYATSRILIQNNFGFINKAVENADKGKDTGK